MTYTTTKRYHIAGLFIMRLSPAFMRHEILLNESFELTTSHWLNYQAVGIMNQSGPRIQDN